MSKRDWLRHLGFTTATAIVASKITKMTQSNEPTIEAMNEVIALFDDWKKDIEGYMSVGKPRDTSIFPYTHYFPSQMKYHTSWDWLMPVVEKILKLKDTEQDLGMIRELGNRWVPIKNELCKINIKNVHYCVYRFIEWRNKKLAEPVVDHGMCARCKISKATTDYNGHGYWVCIHCDDILNDEFEMEYR